MLYVRKDYQYHVELILFECLSLLERKYESTFILRTTMSCHMRSNANMLFYALKDKLRSWQRASDAEAHINILMGWKCFTK